MGKMPVYGPEQAGVVSDTAICYTCYMAYLFYRIPGSGVGAAENEVARYLGYRKSTPPDKSVAEIIRSSIDEMQPVLTPQAVYDIFDIRRPEHDLLEFAGIKLRTEDLSRNLEYCDRIVIFAATIGMQTDTLIRKSQLGNSARAAVMQATGAMFIESFVNSLNAMIRSQTEAAGGSTRPRYSPGYGDVPLSVQKQIFSVLPCTRIGLSLTDTCVMSPEKSVTAFIGIRTSPAGPDHSRNRSA